LYVAIAPAAEQLRIRQERYGRGVPLVLPGSPYRSLMERLLEYIEQIARERRPTTSPSSSRVRSWHDDGVICFTTSARC
jgi:hypothetical protein